MKILMTTLLGVSENQINKLSLYLKHPSYNQTHKQVRLIDEQKTTLFSVHADTIYPDPWVESRKDSCLFWSLSDNEKKKKSPSEFQDEKLLSFP